MKELVERLCEREEVTLIFCRGEESLLINIDLFLLSGKLATTNGKQEQK